jgi:hypothetical protein
MMKNVMRIRGYDLVPRRNRKRINVGAARKHQFGGSTFGGVIGVVQIGEKKQVLL